MIKTFTPDLEIAVNSTETEAENQVLEHAEPSLQTIRNILTYSKNLEIQRSESIGDLSFVRS